MAVSPPRTKPLVAMAEVDRPVMVVTTVAIRMMAMVSPAMENKNKSKTKQKTSSHVGTFICVLLRYLYSLVDRLVVLVSLWVEILRGFNHVGTLGTK